MRSHNSWTPFTGIKVKVNSSDRVIKNLKAFNGSLYVTLQEILSSKLSRCNVDGCFMYAVYGDRNSVATVCKHHRMPGMENVRKTSVKDSSPRYPKRLLKRRQCVFGECKRMALFGFSVTRATTCFEHMLDGMVMSMGLV